MTKTFQDFHFAPFIQRAIEQLHFTKPTEIQEAIFPIALEGKSVVGQSQTGSGKTHAYLFPTLQAIDSSRQEVQVVILAPTRELGRQIFSMTEEIISHCEEGEEIVARLFVGGTDRKRDMDRLKQQPHIIIGTPSRIASLVQERALFIHTAEQLVVDEADLMLDMGFIHEVDKVAAAMSRDLQMLVFSATIPQKLQPLLKKYMENPEHVHINPKSATVGTLEHRLVPTRHRNKINVLLNVMNGLNPFLALIFTNTISMADEVADALIGKGIPVGRLHGDLPPRERKRVMERIENLEYQYIVATDLAARGIDIEGVSHVINFELPSDLDFYVHRTGRTARAGFSGLAITLYNIEDDHTIVQLEDRGIEFTFMDVQNGEWVDMGVRHKRKSRKKRATELDLMAEQLIRKAKKVKPGHRKKRLEEIERFKRRERRKMNNAKFKGR